MSNVLLNMIKNSKLSAILKISALITKRFEEKCC